MTLRNLSLHYLPMSRFAEVNANVAKYGHCYQSYVLALLKYNPIKKSLLFWVTLFIFSSIVLKAQSPQKINFQSIVRNTSGVIVSNKSVSFKLTILSGSTTGTSVYSETHLKTTDAIGLVSLQIGTGTVSSGVFSSIDWGNTPHFIKLEADFNGGSTYVTLGTQELMSVPYAMYATKTDTSSLNLTSRFAEKASSNNPTFTGTVSGIDKNMVGLGNVDNTSDANKPVSTLTQTALNDKAPINNPTFTGTVSGIDKNMVGLGNVDNISDANKPVSTAIQNSLNAKVNIADTASMLTNYRTGLNLKLNISDTAAMLLNYRNSGGSSGSGLPTTGNSLGNMLYWNGSAWVKLPTGSNGQILQINGGIPAWANPDFICGGSKLWDIDGNTYNTILIGAQCWTKENLKVTKYNDGTAIPLDANGGSVGTSTTWQGLRTGAITIYGNQGSSGTNATVYGFLYNRYAVTDIRGLCPTGWHVPTDFEWTILTTNLGGESVAGGKMKSIGTAWNSPNSEATNSSGFSALPGGWRASNGSFGEIASYAFIWSSDPPASIQVLNYNNGITGRGTYDASVGASVRCLRD
jgi:uncharacterized protein (TIGR02145 family)